MSFSNRQEFGPPITVKDEGVTLTGNLEELDFTGDGVTATNVGAIVDAAISGSGSGSLAESEVPSGTVNGSNADFTLANTPLAGSLKLYLNGVRQKVTEDYTLSTATITFNVAPPTGSIILADYRY